MKIISTFTVAIIGIAFAIMLAKSAKKPESKIPQPKLPAVEVKIAEATRHTYRIQSQGTALPRTSIRLVSEVSGKVVSVAKSFDVGQIFTKGDVLLKIDARDYELALAQARSQVAQAQLRLQMEVKEADVVRREWELLNQGEPSGLQAREPQLASARAALEAALAAEEAAKRNLDRCEIRAPFDGMVARAGVRPGQFAALATPLGELFATDVVEVRLPLIASDLSFIDLPRPGAKVALGQARKVTLSARAGERRTEWLGHIVRSEETVDPMNRMVYVVAQVIDPYGLAKRDGAPLRSGTFVRASIEGRTQENVIVLPRQALRGKDRVWIADPSTLQEWLGYRDQQTRLIFRSVDVSFADARQVVITNGIRAGEDVVTSLLAA
ncbi:MAG: efflux RND transporter periplasmic adaptor subunit, partial [Verrucomicrobia bacterium]|nr:efflux RND transporter periplasmic adaptor subunit [Verrucomicrobiota bacterium]